MFLHGSPSLPCSFICTLHTTHACWKLGVFVWRRTRAALSLRCLPPSGTVSEFVNMSRTQVSYILWEFVHIPNDCATENGCRHYHKLFVRTYTKHMRARSMCRHRINGVSREHMHSMAHFYFLLFFFALCFFLLLLVEWRALRAYSFHACYFY